MYLRQSKIELLSGLVMVSIIMGVEIVLASTICLGISDVGTLFPTKKRAINYAMQSIPFLIVRLIYSLLSGFNKEFLDFGESIDTAATRAIMVILMEVFILGVFLSIGYFTSFSHEVDCKLSITED